MQHIFQDSNHIISYALDNKLYNPVIDVQTCLGTGHYNLGLAAYEGNVDEVERIIDLWILNINELDKQSHASVLHYAAFCKDQAKGFKIFKLLVNAGADFNINMNNESTMQLAAERTSNLEIIKLLICKGVKTPTLKDNGLANVHEAVTQLFNKYKYMLIIEKDAPLEVLSSIISLSLHLTYEDRPKKSWKYQILNEFRHIQEYPKLISKSEFSFNLEDAIALKSQDSYCSIM